MPSWTLQRPPRSLIATLLFLAVSVGIASSPSTRESSWELRVCAGGDDLPYSNREEGGFENRIMRAVADQMRATLSYTWLPRLRNAERDLQLLREGTCDLFLDVGESSDDYLPTVDYYQSTYVYVGRPTVLDGITELSLDQLSGLRVGVVAASPPDIALGSQGDVSSLTHYVASADPPEEAIVADVLAGRLDLGIIWGPPAAYLVGQHPERLAIKPVMPEIDLNGIAMLHTAAMGVRPGDIELRDLVNRALAARWSEIGALLEESGIPVVPLPKLVLSLGQEATQGGERLRIGAIVALPTGDQSLDPYGETFVGEAAAEGATLALETLLGPAADAGIELEGLITSAPGVDAAVRAADRLRIAEGVSAIVGGFTGEEAAALAADAREHGLLFVNVGAQDDALRSAACYPTTFHVAASDSMYWSALLGSARPDGAQRLFVVHADAPTQNERHAALERAIAGGAAADLTIDDAMVAPDLPLYSHVFDAIAAAGADLVVLDLNAYAQQVFLGQYPSAGLGATVVGYPDLATQSRDYLAATVYDVPALAFGPRVALWDATLTGGGAEELNQRFLARFGKAMDPAAWAAYASIRAIAEAAVATGSTDAADLAAYLSGGATVDVSKGDGTAFGPATHQLAQPLYVVRANADASVQDPRRVDLASVAEVVPWDASALPAGDGSPATAGACR